MSEIWWSNAKRRAYNYQEKKLNRLNDYDLYLELCAVETTTESLQAILEKNGLKREPTYKIKEMKKLVEAKINKERYEQTIKDEDITNLFTLVQTIRAAPYKPTTAESYAIAINYQYQLLSTIYEKMKSKENTLVNDFEPAILDEVVINFHDNWRSYMDSVPQTEEAINILSSKME